MKFRLKVLKRTRKSTLPFTVSLIVGQEMLQVIITIICSSILLLLLSCILFKWLHQACKLFSIQMK